MKEKRSDSRYLWSKEKKARIAKIKTSAQCHSKDHSGWVTSLDQSVSIRFDVGGRDPARSKESVVHKNRFLGKQLIL